MADFLVRNSYAAIALRILLETALKRGEKISAYTNAPQHQSDDEDNWQCPMMDSFHTLGGSKSIIDMINLS